MGFMTVQCNWSLLKLTFSLPFVRRHLYIFQSMILAHHHGFQTRSAHSMPRHDRGHLILFFFLSMSLLGRLLIILLSSSYTQVSHFWIPVCDVHCSSVWIALWMAQRTFHVWHANLLFLGLFSYVQLMVCLLGLGLSSQKDSHWP